MDLFVTLQPPDSRDRLSCAVHGILSSDHNITFTWLPSHVVLAGNVAADAAAKAALTHFLASSAIPYSEFKKGINSYVSARWQELWDAEVNNKLHKTQP
jgi:hypothetical protein